MWQQYLAMQHGLAEDAPQALHGSGGGSGVKEIKALDFLMEDSVGLWAVFQSEGCIVSGLALTQMCPWLPWGHSGCSHRLTSLLGSRMTTCDLGSTEESLPV